MISMRKNHELFFILEMLLLTPIALFWVGVASMFLTGSESLLSSVIGGEYGMLKGIFITIVCPLAAFWFAYDYLKENKKEKGSVRNLAKAIIAVSVATIILVGIYLFNQS